MIEPLQLYRSALPVFAIVNLHKDHGVYSRCVGVLTPRILIDRQAEASPAFNALVLHEGVHAVEVHAFVGLLLVAIALVSLAVVIALGWLPALLTFALAGGSYVWWRREQETRCDAVALYGAGICSFRSLLLMHGHPKTRFGRWCYGKTRAERFDRANKRCLHVGWTPGD